MSTGSVHLDVAGVDVEVVYKDIRNLHIRVYPPTGLVRVSAPRHLDDNAVRMALVGRLAWIKRNRDRLRAAEPRSPQGMVTGEPCHVWGRRCGLRVIEGSRGSRVELAGDLLVLRVGERTSPEQRRRMLDEWYRRQLRAAVPEVVEKWEEAIEVTVARWTVRRMSTRWGSCNPITGHITLNLELARRHPEGLEYVVVHELTHLLERGHGEAFVRLMDGFLPDWRARRDRLNATPPAHQDWPT